MKNFILILCLATFSQWVYAQNKQITGRVVDTKGEAAIGASILEKGTTNGTITDFDGNFKLTVGPKAVLQISYIGYKTQEIPVANKTKLNITMEEDTEVLDEVVVVGYGAQKKESVVGAISQVSSKELLKSPAANISQAIAGKISGDGMQIIYLIMIIILCMTCIIRQGSSRHKCGWHPHLMTILRIRLIYIV